MKVRYFCVVLLVSGTLCLHADRSHPGSSVPVTLNVQSRCCEAALLGGFSSDDAVLFKIAQEPAPAALVERRDMLGDKVADTLLALPHLTNIDRFVTR